MAGDIKEERALAKGYSVILLLLTLLVCSTEGLNTEGKILLELKKGLHDKSKVLENWRSTDETPCGWVGVNCTHDNINSNNKMMSPEYTENINTMYNKSQHKCHINTFAPYLAFNSTFPPV